MLEEDFNSDNISHISLQHMTDINVYDLVLMEKKYQENGALLRKAGEESHLFSEEGCENSSSKIHVPGDYYDKYHITKSSSYGNTTTSTATAGIHAHLEQASTYRYEYDPCMSEIGLLNNDYANSSSTNIARFNIATCNSPLSSKDTNTCARRISSFGTTGTQDISYYGENKFSFPEESELLYYQEPTKHEEAYTLQGPNNSELPEQIHCDTTQQQVNKNTDEENGSLEANPSERPERDFIVVKRGRITSDASNWLSRETEGGVIYECKLCGRQCRWRSSISVHVRTHTGRKPYRCRICNHGFADSSTRKKHEKKTHGCIIPGNKKTSQSTEETGIVSSQRNNFNYDNVSNNNSNEQLDQQSQNIAISNYKCRVCQSQFTMQSELLNHMQAFQHYYLANSCRFCEATFEDNNATEEHENLYHLDYMKTEITSSDKNETLGLNNIFSQDYNASSSSCYYENEDFSLTIMDDDETGGIPLPQILDTSDDTRNYLQDGKCVSDDLRNIVSSYANETQTLECNEDDPLYLETDPMMQQLSMSQSILFGNNSPSAKKAKLRVKELHVNDQEDSECLYDNVATFQPNSDEVLFKAFDIKGLSCHI